MGRIHFFLSTITCQSSADFLLRGFPAVKFPPRSRKRFSKANLKSAPRIDLFDSFYILAKHHPARVTYHVWYMCITLTKILCAQSTRKEEIGFLCTRIMNSISNLRKFQISLYHWYVQSERMDYSIVRKNCSNTFDSI